MSCVESQANNADKYVKPEVVNLEWNASLACSCACILGVGLGGGKSGGGGGGGENT
jgi:hypothetical protein